MFGANLMSCSSCHDRETLTRRRQRPVIFHEYIPIILFILIVAFIIQVYATEAEILQPLRDPTQKP